MAILLALSRTTGRHIDIAGIIVSGVGAAIIVVGALIGYRSFRLQAQSGAAERLCLAVGSGVLVIGFILQAIGFHYT